MIENYDKESCSHSFAPAKLPLSVSSPWEDVIALLCKHQAVSASCDSGLMSSSVSGLLFLLHYCCVPVQSHLPATGLVVLGEDS